MAWDSDRRRASHEGRTRARLRCPASRCRTSRARLEAVRGAGLAQLLLDVAVGARVLDLAARADVDRLQLELRLDEQRAAAPPSSGTSAGRTSASEMNDRSATIRSKRANGSWLASRWRALTPSSAVTRGSAARRGWSWPWPTSTPTTCFAPRCSSTSVKPPVLWPRSRQVIPATSIARRVSAPSSFRPPRETKRSSASSVISTSASLGRSSPDLVGTRQPAGARQRTAPVAISRCAADRVGAMPRSTRSWSARIASSSAGRSVAVAVGLVRAFLRHADVGRLLVGQLGQHRADLLQVQTRDLLVEVLRQDVDLARPGSGRCARRARSGRSSGWRSSSS